MSVVTLVLVLFQCDVEGEIEYEIPFYNKIETLPGLWDPGNPLYRTTGACYGGIKICPPTENYYLFTAIFPHIQVIKI